MLRSAVEGDGDGDGADVMISHSYTLPPSSQLPFMLEVGAFHLKLSIV